MTPQDKSSGKRRYSAAVMQQLNAAYQALGEVLGSHPWLAQGSVNAIAPKTSEGRVTYTWTRKVRAKTMTVALSRQQAAAFRQAIAANRRLEEALARLRALSQSAILTELKGVTKRRSEAPANTKAKTVPKRA